MSRSPARDRSSESGRSIVQLFADHGIECEVLHMAGDVVRVGIDPEPNPYSTVVRGDATDPPLSGSFDLAIAHPPCGRYSKTTPATGDRSEWPDYIDDARRACRDLAEHYVIENVPIAPLRDPVRLDGRMFGLPIQYERAFETSFDVPSPRARSTWTPSRGPLAEQGQPGKAWVGNEIGWRIAKGYRHPWPVRELKRRAVPVDYLRYLLYWWLAAEDDGRVEQSSIADARWG